MLSVTKPEGAMATTTLDKRIWFAFTCKDVGLGSLQRVLQGQYDISPDQWTNLYAQQGLRTDDFPYCTPHILPKLAKTCFIGHAGPGQIFERAIDVQLRDNHLTHPTAFDDYQGFCDSIEMLKPAQGKEIDVIKMQSKSGFEDFVCLLGDYDDALNQLHGCSVTAMMSCVKRLVTKYQKDYTINFVLDDRKARNLIAACVTAKNLAVPKLHMKPTCWMQHMETAIGSNGQFDTDALDDAASVECKEKTITFLGMCGIAGNEDSKENGLLLDMLLDGTHRCVFIRGLQCSFDDDDKLHVKATPYEVITLMYKYLLNDTSSKLTPRAQRILSRAPSDGGSTTDWNDFIDALENVCEEDASDTDNSFLDLSFSPPPKHVFKSMAVAQNKCVIEYLQDGHQTVNKAYHACKGFSFSSDIAAVLVFGVVFLMYYLFVDWLEMFGIGPLMLTNITTSSLYKLSKQAGKDYIQPQVAIVLLFGIMIYSIFTADFTNFTISSGTTLTESNFYDPIKQFILGLHSMIHRIMEILGYKPSEYTTPSAEAVDAEAPEEQADDSDEDAENDDTADTDAVQTPPSASLVAKKEMELLQKVKSVPSQLTTPELERKLEILLHKNEKCRQENNKLEQEKLSIQSRRLQLEHQNAQQMETLKRLQSDQREQRLVQTAARPLATPIPVNQPVAAAPKVAVVYSRSKISMNNNASRRRR